MSDYTQVTDFSTKDALADADPEKVILGADVDVELSAIATAITSKLNSSGVLAAVQAVDGAGSGIDADSVDGVGPVASSTWTPTVSSYSAANNFALEGSQPARYSRLGSIVHFSMSGTVDFGTAGAHSFRLSLPVASNFASTGDAGGSVSWGFNSTNTGGGRITADVAGNILIINCYSAGTLSAVPIGISGSYIVI